MTAPTAIALEDRFAPATEAVNGWRGRCMACFSRAEATVSEALIRLGATDGKPVLPHLVGPRFVTLATRLEARGDAADAVAAIRTFSAHAELRTFLCHGDGRVLVDRQGRWQAVFTVVAPSRGTIARRFLMIDADEATAVAQELQRDQSRLTKKVVRAVPPASAPIGAEQAVALRIGGPPR